MVIGHPITHSLSPVMHNAAFKALRLDSCYIALDVIPEGLGDFIKGLKATNVLGVNITIPHKENAIEYLDELSEEATVLNTVNTIKVTNGRLFGYNTDIVGFERCLEGIDVSKSSALIIGAGGAGKAVAYALCRLNINRLYITNRTEEKGQKLVRFIDKVFNREAQSIPFGQWNLPEAPDIIVNTTPIGMKGIGGSINIPYHIIKKGAMVIDLIYNPPKTELLKTAERLGARVQNGLKMLVYQGAASFNLDRNRTPNRRDGKGYTGVCMRFLTAGESHGRAIITIVEGIPSGFPLSKEDIDVELARRRQGYGRGNRMNIEPERCEIYAGLRNNRTIGSPIAIILENVDWQKIQPPLTTPRPGHADLPGSIKYNTRDIRDIWERSSARETTARVMAGAIAKKILKELGIRIISYTKRIGSVEMKSPLSLEEIEKSLETSPVRCPDKEVSEKMIQLIDEARERGDTLGGIFEIMAIDVPPGFGTYVHWDRRLDGLIAQAIMSIPSVKGVEIGGGFGITGSFGSEVMDVINYERSHSPYPFYRDTNFAGGLEGGITNGQNIVVRGAVKPIPTLQKPLPSIDLIEKKRQEAVVIRSDVCVVPAAGVIGESMLAWVLADTILQELGGNTWEEVKRRYKQYLAYVKDF